MALGFIPKMMRYTKLLRIRRLFLSRRPVSSIDPIRFTACIPDGMIDLWRHLAPDMIYFPRSTLLNVILPNIWSRNLSLLIMKLITIDATRADIVFRTLQDEWVRNLTIMRARWRAKSVVHWYKKTTSFASRIWISSCAFDGVLSWALQRCIAGAGPGRFYTICAVAHAWRSTRLSTDWTAIIGCVCIIKFLGVLHLNSRACHSIRRSARGIAQLVERRSPKP